MTDETTAELYRDSALNYLNTAKVQMVVSLAIEDGVMSEEEANDYLERSGIERVQSHLYPGDEYYDRAMMELEREL